MCLFLCVLARRFVLFFKEIIPLIQLLTCLLNQAAIQKHALPEFPIKKRALMQQAFKCIVYVFAKLRDVND